MIGITRYSRIAPTIRIYVILQINKRRDKPAFRRIVYSFTTQTLTVASTSECNLTGTE